MKKMMVGWVVLGFAMMLTAKEKPKTLTQVAMTIAGLEQQWVAAIKAGNTEPLGSLLADTFIETGSEGDVRNKAQSIARIKGFKWEVCDIGEVKVTVYGKTAIATGTFHGQGTDADGKSFEAHERWTDTWIELPNGKWQCVASQSSPMKDVAS